MVIEGVPNWFNSSIYIDNNPRKTFVQLFLKKVFNKYKDHEKIKAFQIWNEPNNADFSANKKIGGFR